jgi:hypothetical protein
MRAIEHPDIANPLHQRALGLLGQLIEHGVARFAVTHACSNFDEFVGAERNLELLRHGCGQAALADHHNGLASVSQAAQILSLFFRQIHIESVSSGGAISSSSPVGQQTRRASERWVECRSE